MLLLVNISPIKGYEPFKFVVQSERIDLMREAGASIEILEDQSMCSVLALRQIKEKTGHTIILKQFEKVLGYSYEENLVTVTLSVVDAREVSQGFEIKRIGTRMYGFQLADEKWLGQVPITAWDEEYAPQFVRSNGRSVNLKEWLDNLWFARECARPGSLSNPMDTYERTTDSYASSKMAKHWRTDVFADDEDEEEIV